MGVEDYIFKKLEITDDLEPSAELGKVIINLLIENPSLLKNTRQNEDFRNLLMKAVANFENSVIAMYLKNELVT